MLRLGFGVGFVSGVVAMALVGAALGIRAQDPKTDVETAAAAAGVDAVDLAGAANTVGVDPWVYVRAEGLLERVTPPLRKPVVTIWDRLSQCEASGNWASRSNPLYKGGLQFDAATWARHGGLAFAWRADYATREQQIVVAERTLAMQGPGAWPVCSRVVGLH
jgi:hypothetical protein